MGKLLLDKKGRERMALNKDMIIPEHVALILDGNGRWAKNGGFPAPWGTRKDVSPWRKPLRLQPEWESGI